jgi:hypothetical protein
VVEVTDVLTVNQLIDKSQKHFLIGVVLFLVITNDFSWILALFHFWHPETAVPPLVLSLEVHVHACELDIISLVALVPLFNFLVCVVEQEVVTLLNAVLDNVKFDFGLFLVETPHVFGKCHDVSHNAALVLSLLVSMQRSLRV